MKCPLCKHGIMHDDHVTVTLERGTTTIVFKQVPALVCENCGEQHVSEATAKALLTQGETVVASGADVAIRPFAA